jgi:hypothetical protein
MTRECVYASHACSKTQLRFWACGAHTCMPPRHGCHFAGDAQQKVLADIEASFLKGIANQGRTGGLGTL